MEFQEENRTQPDASVGRFTQNVMSSSAISYSNLLSVLLHAHEPSNDVKYPQ